MPEMSDSNQYLLRRAAGDELSTSTLCESHTVDSDSDNSESLGELGIDLVPCGCDSASSSADEGGLLPETSSNQFAAAYGLRFRNDHYDQGSRSPDLLSSSSDEEGISSGLNFKNVGIFDITKNNSVLAATVRQSQKLIDIEGANPTYQSDSSIDSEFEVIDNEVS